MELELNSDRKWFEEKQVKRTLERLRRNRFSAYYAANKKEVFDYLEQLIPEGAVVGSGDSLSLEQLGVFEWLRGGNFKFLNKFKVNLSAIDKNRINVIIVNLDLGF